MWDEFQTIQRDPSESDLRRFGWKLFFGFIGTGLFWMGLARFFTGFWVIEVFFTFLAVAVFLCLLIQLAPGIGLRIFLGWQYLTRLLEVIMGLVLLGLVYWFFLMPLGLFRRMAGTSPLVKKPGSGAAGYWKPVSSQKTAISYLRQY